MTTEHKVLLKHEPSPDDTGDGVNEIMRAVFRNPMGAFKIGGVIVLACGLWYSTQHSIDQVKADSEQHYKDMTLALSGAVEKLSAKADVMVASDAQQSARIEQVFQRGDARWAQVQAKQSESDVKFARIESSLSYIVRAVGKDGFAPLDK